MSGKENSVEDSIRLFSYECDKVFTYSSSENFTITQPGLIDCVIQDPGLKLTNEDSILDVEHENFPVLTENIKPLKENTTTDKKKMESKKHLKSNIRRNSVNLSNNVDFKKNTGLIGMRISQMDKLEDDLPLAVLSRNIKEETCTHSSIEENKKSNLIENNVLKASEISASVCKRRNTITFNIQSPEINISTNYEDKSKRVKKNKNDDSDSDIKLSEAVKSRKMEKDAETIKKKISDDKMIVEPTVGAIKPARPHNNSFDNAIPTSTSTKSFLSSTSPRVISNVPRAPRIRPYRAPMSPSYHYCNYTLNKYPIFNRMMNARAFAGIPFVFRPLTQTPIRHFQRAVQSTSTSSLTDSFINVNHIDLDNVPKSTHVEPRSKNKTIKETQTLLKKEYSPPILPILSYSNILRILQSGEYSYPNLRKMSNGTREWIYKNLSKVTENPGKNKINNHADRKTKITFGEYKRRMSES